MIVLQFLTYKLSLELFALSSVKVHRKGQLDMGCPIPCHCSAPELRSSCQTAVRALRVGKVSVNLNVIKVFSVARPSIFD